jgi:hypothetical protein
MGVFSWNADDADNTDFRGCFLIKRKLDKIG